MGSTIRSIRNQRNSTRPNLDRREDTKGGTYQKTYDASFTAHSKSEINPFGSLKGEPSQIDHKVDVAHELLRDVIAPRIQSHSFGAATVDRREFFYYKRKHTGRRCSCFTEETSAHDLCPICIGTGIVAGYEKYGTWTEILDFTTPNLLLVNVEPNFEMDTRPVYLRLKDGFDVGYAEATFQIKQNIGEIDTSFLSQPIFNRGLKVLAIDPTGFSSYISCSEELNPFLTHPKITIRIEITRCDSKPMFTHFMFRYKTQPSQLVYGDLSKSEETMAQLSTMGTIDSYQEISIFFDGVTVRRYDPEDLLYRISDGRRFKIVTVTDNIVANVKTSIDLRARYLLPSIDGAIKNLII